VRVVSLLPSATEIMYALGLEDDLVGVTFECDWPPSARTAHRVVVTGLDTEAMSPRDIDDLVHGDRVAPPHDRIMSRIR
jgi:iron complex transport system substrate-binding protein